MITIFILDDDAEVRASLCERLRMHSDFCVSLAVGTCREMRDALRRRAPDVLLADLGLPDGDGIDVVRDAVARYPRLPIMVITVFGDERRVVAALKAGATGYLLKDDGSSELSLAIRQLLAGGSPISPAIARHLIRLFTENCESERQACFSALTAREQEVLNLAAKGYSYAEIAQILSLSTNTIASYTKYIYEKLSVSSRAEAVYEAARLGLLPRA